MKKLYLSAGLLLLAGAVSAQCGSPTTLGSASNMFTLIRNGNNPVSVNKALNMVAFVHRNDAAAFGGNSGQLRYDYSTNGGTTWSLNVAVMNPTTTNLARYPNMAIYNPASNTNTANVYLSYLAPTINSSSIWNGVVTGVSQLNGSGVTETYNQNGIGTNQIPHSMVNGAPGVFWAIDPIVPAATTGYYIYKGVWSNTLNDVVWAINYTITPTFNTSFSTYPTVGDYNIAFDPTGTTGYASFLGHVTPGSSNYALNPVLWKTTNGGASWTGPIQVDMSRFSCISSNTVSPNVPSVNTEHDLVVDVNGNPHIITTVGNASNYSFNYNAWHHMYDITLKNGVWAAVDLGNVNGAPYTSGVSPNYATQWQAPQAARTADGSKVFFTWTDNSSYSLGQSNNAPNLFGKAYDVVQNKWTPTKDFTSCSAATSGTIIFPHVAPEVLEPSSNQFKLAVVYGEMVVANDLGQTANFKFLDNVTFASTDFSITPPTATVSIAQAPNLLLCPGSTVVINVTNAGEALWSTGVNSTTLGVSSPTISAYTVSAQVGCLVGTASISVSNLTVNASPVTPTVCPGNPATFTAVGNALGYTWTPGAITGTNVVLNPTAGTVTLSAMGSSSCITTQTVAISMLPAPVLSVSGPDTICEGHVEVYTGNGASTYAWSNGATTGTVGLSPSSNTVFSVTGTAANSCTGSATFTIAVKPSPTITATSSQTAICMGSSVGLVALGAGAFTWNPGSAPAPTVAASPTASTIYSVTGMGPNQCTTTKTVEVVVNPLPSLTVTPSKATLCVGEKGTLTVTGGTSYVWTNPGSTSPTVQISPQTTTTYTVSGKNSFGCSNTFTYSQVVSACDNIAQNTLQNAVNLFPNPSNGEFTVSAPLDSRIEIFSETGQLVSSTVVKTPATEISGLAKGLYFVRVSSANEAANYRIVVR